MSDYDVIIGMDWLARHHASLDCFARMVTFQLLGMDIIMVVSSGGNALTEELLARLKGEDGLIAPGTIELLVSWWISLKMSLVYHQSGEIN